MIMGVSSNVVIGAGLPFLRMCLGTFSARERAAKQQFPLRELCILGPIRAFFDFQKRQKLSFSHINSARSFLEIKKTSSFARLALVTIQFCFRLLSV